MNTINVKFKDEIFKTVNHLAKLENCAVATLIERLVEDLLKLREEQIVQNKIKMRENLMENLISHSNLPSNAKFNLFMLESVKKYDIERLSKVLQLQLDQEFATLAIDPTAAGNILKIDDKPYFKLKFGDCRVFYRLNSEKKQIIIVSINHRKDIFADF